MKKLFAVILALTLMLSMNVFVSAAAPASETEIPLTADSVAGDPSYFASADQLTFGDSSLTADGVEIISLSLPQNVNVDETVTVHIKGSADDNFRSWLIGADISANKGDHATFSNMWVAADNGFTSGEFEFYYDLTAVDAEPIGGTQANRICFKAPASHGILSNLTLTYVGISYASSAGEVEIPIDTDHLTGDPTYFAPANQLTFGDNTVTADNVQIIAFALPQNVNVDETVTVHIKGSSDGNFRTWLIGADVTENKGDHATFSEMWVASEHGFTSGEFEFYVTLTAYDAEPIGGTSANKLCFKAPSSGGILNNLTLTYIGITYNNGGDIEAAAAAAIEEIKEYVDQSAAALEAAQAAAGDKAALEAALADAQAAVDAISASGGVTRGYKDVLTILNDAKTVVSDIQALIKSADAEEAVANLQSYIDTVNAAYETAKNAGSDVAAAEAALAEAQAAQEYVRQVGNDTGYTDVLATARELLATVREMETFVEDARVLKAQEDAEAAKAAADAEAKAAQTRNVLTVAAIVVVAVAVVAAVVAVVLNAAKKKKKD